MAAGWCVCLVGKPPLRVRYVVGLGVGRAEGVRGCVCA